MTEQNGDEKSGKTAHEPEDLEEKYLDIHRSIIRTIKERKRVETEYLDVIKNQIKYWKSQLEVTDPSKDKERYDELKQIIERENGLIGQIKEELERIKGELKSEEEYQKKNDNLQKR